jgi:hypothetical protein
MMMNFMYTYTKTIKEANAHKLGRPPGESRRRNQQGVGVVVCVCGGEYAMTVLIILLTGVAQHTRGCGAGYK